MQHDDPLDQRLSRQTTQRKRLPFVGYQLRRQYGTALVAELHTGVGQRQRLVAPGIVELEDRFAGRDRAIDVVRGDRFRAVVEAIRERGVAGVEKLVEHAACVFGAVVGSTRAACSEKW